MSPRATKIVCTVGPATASAEAVRSLVEAGMDVARLNFSHGSHEEHAQRVEWIRAASTELGHPVAILQDLCGPKIRTSRSGGPTEVEDGQRIKVIAGDTGRPDAIAVNYPALTQDLQVKDRILLGDGEIELRVEEVQADALVCHVEHGGALRSRQGANLPAERISVGTITPQDREDLAFGLGIGVDYVALSFVRSVDDLKELRALCAEHGRPDTPVVPKIETPGAVAEIEAIARASDALMLARGDLGVELSPEAVPVVQKQVIEVCRRTHTPVIVATEMLQSMVEAPRPTRAEANDVANAVFDGADATMLSAETASGRHPALACATMGRIIAEAEGSPLYQPVPSEVGSGTPEAIARGACELARRIGARAIVVLSRTGATARLLSKARPDRRIVGVALEEPTLRRMALYWGVEPVRHDLGGDIEEVAARAREEAVRQGHARSGERLVLVFGLPLGDEGSTNSIRVEEIP